MNTFPFLFPRTPPSNIEVEQMTLGAFIAGITDPLAAELEHGHFADQLHGAIWLRIKRRAAAGQPYDAVALKGEMEPDGILDEAGGGSYLAELARLVGEVAR